ncbi:hypothetical protein R6Q57_008911 [Mikania cordata]
MISKRFLLIALAFAIALLITSEIVAARELASNNENALEDAKHDYDKDDHDKHDHDKDDHDDDYYDHDRNHNHGKDDHYDHADDWHDHADDYYDHDRDHNHYDHGDHYDHRDHDWDDHDHGYNGWGHRRRFCRYGCCGHKDDYYRGCRCCATLEEAITYKQAYESQTHN